MTYARRLGQTELMDLLAPLKSRVQADLGKFLAARHTLEQAQARALAPDQQLTVASLLADQAELEGQVGDVLGPIQAGTYSVDSVTAAALFLGRMELHLANVDKFVRALGGAAGLAPTVSFNWPTIALWGGLVVGAFGAATQRPVLMVGGAAVAAVGWWNQ